MRVSHPYCQPPQLSSGNSRLPHDAAGWQIWAFCFLFLLCLTQGAAWGLQGRMAWEHLWALSHTQGRAKQNKGEFNILGCARAGNDSSLRRGKGKNTGFPNPPQQVGMGFLWVQTWCSLGKGLWVYRVCSCMLGEQHTGANGCRKKRERK